MPIDPQYYFRLRCYSEGNLLIKNFDSIPCDSIRPAFSKTSTTSLKPVGAKIYLSGNQLYVMNQSTEEIKNISLFDLRGQMLFTQQAKDQLTEINIQAFKSGLYILKWQFKNGAIFSKKLIYINHLLLT